MVRFEGIKDRRSPEEKLGRSMSAMKIFQHSNINTRNPFCGSSETGRPPKIYQRIPNVSGKTLVSTFLVNARW